MAFATNMGLRERIGEQLMTPLAAHDPLVRSNMTEGDLIRELPDRRYTNEPVDSRHRMISRGNPVHWMVLAPSLRDGGLVAIEFGAANTRLAIPYDAEAEREAVRRDIAEYGPNLKPEVQQFYNHIRPDVTRRVTREEGQHVFVAVERRYPEGAEGDSEQGWTQLIMSRKLLQASTVVQNRLRIRQEHSGPAVIQPKWLTEAAEYQSRETVARIMALSAISSMFNLK